MSERVEGCEVPFGSSGYLKMIPACMDGTWLNGCAQRETCEVWASYGRDNVEKIQANFSILMAGKTPDEFIRAIYDIASLSLAQINEPGVI